MPTKYIELRLQNVIVHAAKEPDTLLAQIAIFHRINYTILHRRLLRTQLSWPTTYHDEQLFSAGKEIAIVWH